jgi:serine/threonine protein kinase
MSQTITLLRNKVESTTETNTVLHLMLRKHIYTAGGGGGGAGWLPHEEFARTELQLVDRRQPDRIYTLVPKSLGTSKYGEIWAAAKGAVSDAVIRSPDFAPTHIVQLLNPIGDETLKELEERAQREVNIGLFVRRLDSANRTMLCRDSALCSDEWFVSRKIDFDNAERVVVVFGFKSGSTLLKFLVEHLFPVFSKENEVQCKIQVLRIASFLGYALSNLNVAGVFHGNVNPNNILVSFIERPNNVPLVTGVRLINFDRYSCVLIKNIYDAMLSEISRERKIFINVSCSKPVDPNRFIYPGPPPPGEANAAEYYASLPFRDPNVPEIVVKTSQLGAARDQELESVRIAYARAEAYSYALIVQLCSDPVQLREIGAKTKRAPIIRIAKRATGGVTDELYKLTNADYNARPPMYNVAKQFEDLYKHMEETKTILNVENVVKNPAIDEK